MGIILLRRVAAVVGTYLVAMICLNHVIYSFLKVNYWKYQAVFYSVLFGLGFLIFPVKYLTVRTGRALFFGAIAGYIAGLITFFFSPLFNRWDFHRVFVVWDLGLCFFLSPIVALSWLAGIYFALGVLIQDRFVLSSRTQRLVRKVHAVGQRI